MFAKKNPKKPPNTPLPQYKRKKPNNNTKVINQFKKKQPNRFLWEFSSLTYEHTYVNLVNYIHSMNNLV